MLEWIESPSHDLQSFVSKVQGLTDYSTSRRIHHLIQGFQVWFPRSRFEILDGGLDLREGVELRKYSFIANLDQDDIHQKSPRWLSGSDDYFWIWSHLTESLKRAALDQQIELNYFKENRDRLHFVMRNYELSRPSERSKSNYHFDLRVIDSVNLETEARGLVQQGWAIGALRPGLLLKIDLLLTPDTLLFFEKSTALIRSWFANEQA